MMNSGDDDHIVEDETVADFLKMMNDNKNDWHSQCLPSEDVFCRHPLTLFDPREGPLSLQAGGDFFAIRTMDSGKTDRCEAGCWRVMCRDKLIKTEENGKVEILGFKKVYKFCETPEPRAFFKWMEMEKIQERDKRTWVMEEFRLASQWKQGYVMCRVRCLYPNPLKCLIYNHLRGY